MKGTGKLTGTPWHVETLTIGEDKKRHRSHCRYFDVLTKGCMYLCTPCIGSSHCDYYKELKPEEEKKRNAEARKRRQQNAPKKQSKEVIPGMIRPKNASNTRGAGIPILPGAKVRSSVYKAGKVIAVNGNKITVRFANNVTKVFTYPGCLSFLEITIR